MKYPNLFQKLIKDIEKVDFEAKFTALKTEINNAIKTIAETGNNILRETDKKAKTEIIRLIPNKILS